MVLKFGRSLGRSLGRSFVCVAVCLFCPYSVESSGISSISDIAGTKYLDDSQVFFGIEKSGDNLELVGKENGVEKLKIRVADSAFPAFTESVADNFHISSLNNALLFRHKSDDDRETLALLVGQSGDVELWQTEQAYTGWNEHRTYGIKTSGILKNNGVQAFYFLVASANQIHNHGTIQAHSCQLFQNYLFNSGELQFGEMPTEIVDLPVFRIVNKTATPSFKSNTIENYGALKSSGKFSIDGMLHYIEHGISSFDDLNARNCNISIDPGKSMLVSGNMTGGVRHLGIGNGGVLLANSIGFSQLQDLNIGEKGTLHSPNSYGLNINGNFSNSGEVSSGADMTLYLKNLPTVKQSGAIIAKNNLNYSFERSNRPRNSAGAPNITKDPIARQYLLAHHPDPNSYEFKKLQDDFYRRVGYKPELNDPNENTVLYLAKKIRQVVYIDHYLNTITYHYTITKDQHGREIKRELTDVTETGYILQNRTQETREINVPPQQAIDQALDKKSLVMSEFKDSENKRTLLAKGIAKLAAAKKEADMQARFLEALKKALRGAGVSNPDVLAILSNPSFKALVEFDSLPPEQQEKLM
ncbi:MAG: hypothetical protein LBG13_03305, partial [Holosporales bacterium]|nr:hypothetical protein [Holosporales bacterium]